MQPRSTEAVPALCTARGGFRIGPTSIDIVDLFFSSSLAAWTRAAAAIAECLADRAVATTMACVKEHFEETSRRETASQRAAERTAATSGAWRGEAAKERRGGGKEEAAAAAAEEEEEEEREAEEVTASSSLFLFGLFARPSFVCASLAFCSSSACLSRAAWSAAGPASAGGGQTSVVVEVVVVG